MITRRENPILALALLLAGCAEYDFSKGTADSGPQAPAEDGGVTDYLRVDIYPSDQNPDLLPETHILDEEWQGIELLMSSPVTLAGEVWGYDATPYFDISVPGSSIPIEARVSIYERGTVMSASAHTEATTDGVFSLRLPRGDDYTFSVVPVEPLQLPFFVEQGRSVQRDTLDEIIEIDYGAPVYGVIDNLSGVPLDHLDIELWLVDPVTGTAGPRTTPEDNGFYQLRGLPGQSYQVVMAGATGELVPTTRRDITVESEEGTKVDFTLGSIQGVTVTGQVTSSAGSAVGGATVRFSSLELFEFPGGELELDDITSSQGEYRVALLPGRYMTEFIAPASMELSPNQVSIIVEEEGTAEDHDMQLGELQTVACQILGPDGEPLDGVTVVATERGFDGYTYAATTDESGHFELAVPDVKLQFVLTPPEGEASVTYVDAPVADFPAIIMLEEGDAITGTVKQDDQAVAFALVEVRDSDDQLYATTMTDEKGRFEVRVRWEGETVDLPLDTGLAR